MKRSEFLGLLALPFLAPLIKLDEKPTGQGLIPQIQNNKSQFSDISPDFVWTEMENVFKGDLLVDEFGETLYCSDKKDKNMVKLHKTFCTQPPIGKRFAVVCHCLQEGSV